MTADNDPTFSEMKDVTVTTQYPLSYNQANLTPRPEKSSKEALEKRNAKVRVSYRRDISWYIGALVCPKKNISIQQRISHLEQHFLFSSPAWTLHREQQRHQESAKVLIRVTTTKKKRLNIDASATQNLILPAPLWQSLGCQLWISYWKLCPPLMHSCNLDPFRTHFGENRLDKQKWLTLQTRAYFDNTKPITKKSLQT